jgi:hypothetical protein
VDGRGLQRAAERAVEAGLFVFPVWPRGKTPAIAEWETRATRDLAKVERWWRARPFNIGAAVGRSRIVVVDLDTRRRQDIPPPGYADCASGGEVLTKLAAEREQTVPDTYTVRTPSGGVHRYYRMPEGVELRNTQGRLGWKIIWSRSWFLLVGGLAGSEVCEASGAAGCGEVAVGGVGRW